MKVLLSLRREDQLDVTGLRRDRRHRHNADRAVFADQRFDVVIFAERAGALA